MKLKWGSGNSRPGFNKRFFQLVCFPVLLLSTGAAALWIASPDLSGVRERLSFNAYDDRQNPVRRELVPGSPGFVSASDLPGHVVGAVIGSEDAGFFHHRGVDWGEVKHSIKKNIKEKRYARGASTITQQVVKNAFLTSRKTLWRKLMEMITALRLERILTKHEILDYYINLMELGPGIYGIREGSCHYFNVGPEDLTPYQAALLAFFIPNPSKYGRDYSMRRPSAYRNERVRRIFENMVFQNYITRETYNRYFPHPNENNIKPIPPIFPGEVYTAGDGGVSEKCID